MSVKDLATSSFAKAAEDIKNAKKAWPTTRLGDVCENSIKRLRQIDDEEFEYIDISSIDRSLKTITECKVISRNNAPSRAQQVIEQGDVLVSTVRPNLNAVAMVGEKIQFQRIGSTGFCVLRAAEKILPSYIFRVVQTEGFINSLVRVAEKAAYPSVTDDEVKAFQFPLPPLTVQREIVARLEKELGEADKLAAKFKRVAELADNAFKAELDETFKTLEDNSRRDAETRRVRLGDVCERITKGTTPTSVGYCFVESGINFVKIESFSEDGTVLINRVAHISPECHLALKRSQLQAEDVLFSIAGAIGRVAIVGEDLLPANTNQALAIIRTSKEKSLDVKFLKYSLCSCSVKEQYVPMQKTTAQSNLSLQNVSDFILSIPTLDAQRAIVAKLDAAKERCEKLKAAAMRGHAAAENLRKAILAEAFEQ